MTKQQYLDDLRRFLSGLPTEEQEQALKYYEDYFEDAGTENENSVIEQLGEPSKLAKQIMATNHDYISYGNSFEHVQNAPSVDQQKNNNNNQNANCYQNAYNGQNAYTHQNTYNNQYAYNGQTEPKKSWTQDSGKVALVIILAILAIPVGIPLLGIAFGIIVSIVCLVFGLLFSLFAVGGALVVSGIVALIAAISSFSVSIPGGLLVLGITLIFLSLGIAILWFGGVLCGKFLPSFFKSAGKLFKEISKKIKSSFQ